MGAPIWRATPSRDVTVLAGSVIVSWSAWLGWECAYPPVREAAFPFDLWQIAGCGACLVAVIVAVWVRLGPRTTLTTVAAALILSCTVSSAFGGEVAVGYWILAAVLVIGAAGAGLVLVGPLAIFSVALLRAESAPAPPPAPGKRRSRRWTSVTSRRS